MMQIFTNARLSVGVVAQHLTDDPVVLFLQISRRLPVSLVTKVSRLLGSLVPRRSATVPALLAALCGGDHSDVERRLQLAIDRGVSGQKAKRLADIAIAANMPALADQCLIRAAHATGVKSTQARRFWHEGSLSAAVEVLEGAGAAGQRQRLRLASELAVLHGKSPHLAPRRFRPVPNRVLHLLTNSLPHTASGYAQRSHSVLLAQQKAGWDVLAVTRLGYPVQVGKLLARSSDVVDGIRYTRLLPSKLAAAADARLQQQAEDLLRVALDFRPSVIHTTTHYTNAVVAKAVAEALGIPWVYEVRGQLADTWASTRGPQARNSERYRLFQLREGDAMRSADLVVTLGHAMKANIVAAGVSESRIMIAPNAVGGAYLLEPADQASARRELGLAEDGQYIGTVSSLVPYEGIDDLIAAFALLAPANPELRLLVVGAGTSLPALQSQARRTGFADRIIFPGRVPRDLARTYHLALDIFVVPRKDLEVTRSVTPLKPVEAMACSRAVVASRLPALEELVTDGTNGLLAAAGDSRNLATKLESLLGSEELRSRLGQAGRLEVLQNRTWEANASALGLAYQKIMEARS
jgi:glycosyltransferase involved in cell wall biosynthesis